ncbi:hypothetical protein PtB15_14B318 [Puccinia triticina]|nr:hypothetical protein PtB15_14B318 [Puccinia triticina]
MAMPSDGIKPQTQVCVSEATLNSYSAHWEPELSELPLASVCFFSVDGLSCLIAQMLTPMTSSIPLEHTRSFPSSPSKRTRPLAAFEPLSLSQIAIRPFRTAPSLISPPESFLLPDSPSQPASEQHLARSNLPEPQGYILIVSDPLSSALRRPSLSAAGHSLCPLPWNLRPFRTPTIAFSLLLLDKLKETSPAQPDSPQLQGPIKPLRPSPLSSAHVTTTLI